MYPGSRTSSKVLKGVLSLNQRVSLVVMASITLSFILGSLLAFQSIIKALIGRYAKFGQYL